MGIETQPPSEFLEKRIAEKATELNLLLKQARELKMEPILVVKRVEGTVRLEVAIQRRIV